VFRTGLLTCLLRALLKRLSSFLCPAFDVLRRTVFDGLGLNGLAMPQSLISPAQAGGPECLSIASVQRISPSALAYLGDAVYELYVRRAFVFPPQRIQAYHQQVVSWVRAEAQAETLDQLVVHLTESELAVVKRGRNAAPQRLKRVDPEIYQKATALETLFGYLHLTDPNRLMALLATIAPLATENAP
jgi:ribonuclease III family protein